MTKAVSPKMARSRASVPTPFTAVGLVVSSILISGVLYTLATPHLSHFLGDIGRPAAEVPWWAIIALRAVEVLGYATSGYTSVKDVVSLSVISRTAYSTVLCFFFDIPPGIPALTTVIDTISIVLPILALRHSDKFTGRSIKQQPKSDEHTVVVPKESSLSLVLTLISASAMSISAYVAVKTYLPSFIIRHFDNVKSALPIPLPFLLLGFLPAGYCLQETLYTRGFHMGTLSILVSSFVVGCGNIAIAIRGGDALGVLGVVQFWNVTLAFTCCIIGYILRN